MNWDMHGIVAPETQLDVTIQWQPELGYWVGTTRTPDCDRPEPQWDQELKYLGAYFKAPPPADGQRWMLDVYVSDNVITEVQNLQDWDGTKFVPIPNRAALVERMVGCRCGGGT